MGRNREKGRNREMGRNRDQYNIARVGNGIPGNSGVVWNGWSGKVESRMGWQSGKNIRNVRNVGNGLGKNMVCDRDGGKSFLKLLVSIENNPDKWVTGEHVNVPFTATAYKAKHCVHLKCIMDFETKTCKHSLSPQTYAQICLVSLFQPVPGPVLICLFRKHARVSKEGAAQASNISNTEIEAAK